MTALVLVILGVAVVLVLFDVVVGLPVPVRRTLLLGAIALGLLAVVLALSTEGVR